MKKITWYHYNEFFGNMSWKKYLFIWLVINLIVCNFINDDFNNLTTICLLNVVFLFMTNYKFLAAAIQTVPRDFKGWKTLIAVERVFKKHLKKGSTMGSIFHENVQKYANKVAFIDIESNRAWTFLEFEQFANKIANYFLRQKFLVKGDVVALLAENSVEYIGIWLGLSKIGVVTALINNNLKSDPLAHCLRDSNVKCIIAQSPFRQTVDHVKSEYNDLNHIPVYTFDLSQKSTTSSSFLSELQEQSADEPTSIQLDFRDIVLYIYTSGTTGLPKAAIITQGRLFVITLMPKHCFGLTDRDRLYVMMPMYHTAGGLLGAAQTLVVGCTSVIRKKFSASKFWTDCVEYKCTASQYIGELCRYLLAQPRNVAERQHSVRLMYGNGMRKEYWTDFVNRFGVEFIGEVYGSTEGNATVVNLDNTVGACGFFPIYPWVLDVYPIRLIKVDEQTGELERDPKTGLCVRARPGQYGEMIGKIIKNNPIKEFSGYVSKTETKKKMITDVFSKGDVAFSTGDILYMDEKGYLFFHDRTGDTFRWKGENVSTTEVESIIQKIIGLKDAVVYGTEIPEHDGKAGVVAIVDDGTLNLKDLNQKMTAHLPSYAKPLFVRLKNVVETTGTHKLIKSELQKESIDPVKCGKDKLYYFDKRSDSYRPFTLKELSDIKQKKIMF